MDTAVALLFLTFAQSTSQPLIEWLGAVIKPHPAGAQLKAAPAGGAMNRAGLHPDDIIIELDRQKVDSSRAFWRIAQGLRPSAQVSVRLKRGDQIKILVLHVPPKPRAVIRISLYEPPESSRVSPAKTEEEVWYGAPIVLMDSAALALGAVGAGLFSVHDHAPIALVALALDWAML